MIIIIIIIITIITIMMMIIVVIIIIIVMMIIMVGCLFVCDFSILGTFLFHLLYKKSSCPGQADETSG